MTQNEEDGVTTATPTKTWSMAELRKTKRSLYIRNDTPLMWTLHENTGGGRVDLELGPSGAPNSIRYLAPYALDAEGIARNLSKGKITVSPDLEEEMIERMGVGSNASKGLLDQFQIKVETSPQARAINVQDKVEAARRQGQNQGITPQGQQGNRTTVDEFNAPQPFKVEDGRWFDPIKAEFISAPGGDKAASQTESDIKSVTITAPKRLAEDH